VRAAIDRRREDRKRGLGWYDEMSVARAFDTENDAHNGVGYGKGAQVLRVLEDQIGQGSMLASMRAFLSRRRSGEAAEWPEFEAAVKLTAGEDLRWFFAQWLERPGMPKVELSNITVRSEGNESVVSGRILQANPFYRVKIPVVLELRSGDTVRQTVEIRDASTEFTIRMTGIPDSLTIDPEMTVRQAVVDEIAAADGFVAGRGVELG